MLIKGDDWECTLGENKKPLRHNNDGSNIYGINNLDYSHHDIDTAYSPETNENESNSISDSNWMKVYSNNNYLKDDNIDSKSSSENIIVVNSSDNDDNEIDVSDDEVIPLENSNKKIVTIQPTTTSFDDDDGYIESSGDGLENDNDKAETKENYFAIPISSNPKASVASHLQRLTQLVQSLSDSQTNKSQTYNLSPNELNNFLANHNIQTEYQHVTNTDKIKMPENGQIQSAYMSQILELQKKLQDLNKMASSTPTTIATTTVDSLVTPTVNTNTEPLAFYFNKLDTVASNHNPQNTKIHIKSNTPTRMGIKSPDNGYSSSQIVINRPEGSVLFSIPANYPMDSSLNKNSVDEKHDSYITQDTLKTILELSKQMIGSSLNNKHSTVDSIQNQKYLQPIVQPIYYNIPIQEMDMPDFFEYDKHKLNYHQTRRSQMKKQKPNNQEAFVKPPNFSQSNESNDYKSDEDSQPIVGYDNSKIIAHTHIPIKIESNTPIPSAKQPAQFPQQMINSEGISRPPVYTNSMYINPINNINHMPSQQYQSVSEFSYPSYPYSNGYQQINPQYSPQQYQKQLLSYNTSPSSPLLLPSQFNLPNYYGPMPHFINDQNVNSFLHNFNTQFYPTIRPFSYASPFNTSAYMTTNQMFPNQMYSNQIVSPLNQINSGIQSMNIEKITEPSAIVDSITNKKKKSSDNYMPSSEESEVNEYDDTNNDDDNNEISNELNENINNSNIMSKLYGELNRQSTSSFLDDQLGSTSDNKKRVVNFGGNFMSYDMFQKNIAPLLANNGGISSRDFEVITCVTGSRQPNKTDCTRYFVCNSRTGSIMPYICPPYTAFNSQSRFCDAKTYATCHPPVQMQKEITIDENRRIQMKAEQELNEANHVRDEAFKTQRLASMIRKQTENMLLQQQQQNILKKKLSSTNSMLSTNVSQRPIPILYQETTVKPSHPRIRKITCRETGKQPDTLSKFNYFLCYRGTDNIMRARKMTCPGALMFCRSTNLCTSLSRCGSM